MSEQQIPNLSRMAPRHRPQKTAILLAQRIVNEITEQALVPGTMLPSERDMLQAYGVARGTLREALRFLEIQGVLKIRPGPGGGPTVNGIEPHALASGIALLLQLVGAPFSTILEARQLLEPATAAMAADRVNRAVVKGLRASLEAMEAVLDDSRSFFAENREFHTLIARASGNRLFEILQGSLGWIIDASALGVRYDRARRLAIMEAHRAICDAIEAGDAAAAEAAMRQHMEEFARYMKRHYRHVLKEPLRWDQTTL